MKFIFILKPNKTNIMICGICNNRINNNPAILTSPASKIVYNVKQYHLCRICFNEIIIKITKRK